MNDDVALKVANKIKLHAKLEKIREEQEAFDRFKKKLYTFPESEEITEEELNKYLNIDTVTKLKREDYFLAKKLLAMFRKIKREEVAKVFIENRRDYRLSLEAKRKSERKRVYKERMHKRHAKWSEEEIELLEKYYPILPTKLLLRLLGPDKTILSVRAKANRLRIIKRRDCAQRVKNV